jgi:3-oxoadipate enol-lactonase
VGFTRYTRSGELRIAYETRGGWRHRRPWLVLIQGLGFDRTGWDPVADLLKRDFRLLLVDNRGSGRSGPTAGRVSVSDLARDVVSVLDTAGLARVHVAGASLGGMVAQEVAIGHPDRVDRLVLACTTPGWPYAYPMPVGTAALLAATRRMDPDVALRRNVANTLSRETARNRPDLVERLVEHQRRHRGDPRDWYALMSAGAWYTGNRRQTGIRAPTLVLHGSDDHVVDPRNAELLARRIPDARLRLFPGLGHLFFWEDPEGFVGEVARFLLLSDGLAPDGPDRPAGEPARKEPT